MDQSTRAVEVENIAHRYGQRQALAGVSFAVEPGEVVGLLGPNGGGKTTLFRILATLLTPTSGEARVFGASAVTRPDAVRPMLGVVFQRPALDEKLSVTENLRHHGRLYGLWGAELSARISSALETVGLSARASDRVQALSGGLQRRAELAQGLLHRPRLLLLDEPNTGLDPTARREFLDHLERLRDEEGTTVLLTTHFMEEAERCDRVGIMHEGRLVAFDDPGRLKAGIGGDILVIQCEDPEGLRPKMASRLGVEPALVNGTLRLEAADAHRLVSEVARAFPGEVTSVTWGPPHLDDVFVHLTGHGLEEAPK